MLSRTVGRAGSFWILGKPKLLQPKPLKPLVNPKRDSQKTRAPGSPTLSSQPELKGIKYRCLNPGVTLVLSLLTSASMLKPQKSGSFGAFGPFPVSAFRVFGFMVCDMG